MGRVVLRRAVAGLLAAAVLATMGGRGMTARAARTQDEEYPDRNLLAGEKSPYLLQHADNPVWWYPWGEKAFAKARARDKPVFLSIGYSTCHWCHVMERESFEDPRIAEILNRYFVAVKVDREERPDIDQVFMQAVIAMTGGGGWPMSVFLTPDKKPFYGGTYFPPESRWGQPGFKDLLLAVHEAWTKRRRQVLRSADEMTGFLKTRIERPRGGADGLDEARLRTAADRWAAQFDRRHGGFGGAPKFPMAHVLSFLLRADLRSEDPRDRGMVVRTLDAMAGGGIFDHLGGGFHRYAVDEAWRVPHFEKMLYDQAMLSRAYLEAYQVTGRPQYARVVRETLDYVLRDMQAPSGGFYSAEDADSLAPEETASPAGGAPRRAEGAFYLWRKEEVDRALGPEDAAVFAYVYGVTVGGNAPSDPHGEFAGKNILHVAHGVEEAAARFGRPAEEIRTILARSRKALFELRLRRPRPHLDDKVLTDWNGLMIASLAAAGRALDEPRYVSAAERAAGFLLGRLRRPGDGRLFHRYRDGEAAIPGTLDDYAFLVHGLLELYEADFDPAFLEEARRLTEEMIRLFWDDEGAGFFLTADDAEEVLARVKDIGDGALPSGNAIAALDLLRMGRMTGRGEWEQKARRLLAAYAGDLGGQGWIAADFAVGPVREVVLAGDPNDPALRAMQRELASRFLPRTVTILRPAEGEDAARIAQIVPFVARQGPLGGKATAYVCRNHHCDLPVTDVARLRERLRGRHPSRGEGHDQGGSKTKEGQP